MLSSTLNCFVQAVEATQKIKTIQYWVALFVNFVGHYGIIGIPAWGKFLFFPKRPKNSYLFFPTFFSPPGGIVTYFSPNVFVKLLVFVVQILVFADD